MVIDADFQSPELTPINSITLAGVPSPGYAEISNLSAPRRLRIMPGMGFSDAIVAFAGYEPVEFSVKIHLYTNQHWIDFHEGPFSNLLIKKTSGAPFSTTPYDIAHPFLNSPIHNITAVIIKDVIGPQRLDDTGGWFYEIKMVSYKKPKLAYSKVEGSKDKPLDALDRQLANNQTTIGQRESTLAALQNQSLTAPK